MPSVSPLWMRGSALCSLLLVALPLGLVACERSRSPQLAAALPTGAGAQAREDAGAPVTPGASPALDGAIAEDLGSVDAGGVDADTVDAGAVVPDAVPTLESAMRSYLSWTKRTPEPVSISSEIFGLCRSPSAAEQAFAESEHGPQLFLLDWLNAAAVRTATGMSAPPFPVGAAIVKEKLKLVTAGKYDIAALGIMIKRERGFDPARGDWQFGYWEEVAGLLAGADEARYCGGCHAGSPTDFVFLDQSWRLEQ